MGVDCRIVVWRIIDGGLEGIGVGGPVDMEIASELPKL